MSTILVIDDDSMMRQGIAAMMKSAGHEVIEASDGEAGLKAALAQHPDLIVTDVHMPHMTGLEMLEQLRADSWGKTAQVVVLTSDSSSQVVNDALESGVTSYFDKTLDPLTLTDQIVGLLPASK